MELEQFIDEMVAEKGFTTEDPEVLAQIKADLMESAENRINATILAALPENELAGFESVLDTGDDAAVMAFVKERVPDIDERIAAELLSFKTAYSG